MASIILSTESVQLSRDAECLQTTTCERRLLLPYLLEHKQVSQNTVTAIPRTDARVKDTAAGEVPFPSAFVGSELT